MSDVEVLAMMNVVTGVFVESALGSAREEQRNGLMGEPYDDMIRCGIDRY